MTVALLAVGARQVDALRLLDKYDDAQSRRRATTPAVVRALAARHFTVADLDKFWAAAEIDRLLLDILTSDCDGLDGLVDGTGANAGEFDA